MIMKLGELLLTISNKHLTGKKFNEILSRKKCHYKQKKIVLIPTWYDLTLCKF